MTERPEAEKALTLKQEKVAQQCAGFPTEEPLAPGG